MDQPLILGQPLFSVRVEPAPGYSLTYTGENILLRVTLENTAPSEITVQFEKAKHHGVFLKFTDGKDPALFNFLPRCPGGDEDDEHRKRDEAVTTLAPGSSVSFFRPVLGLHLEQFRGPEEVDVVCQFAVRMNLLVGGEWLEQRATGAARIQGRREVKK